jgi:hypothetical protein
VSYSHAYVSKLLLYEWKPHVKSHSACLNQTFACWKYVHACRIHTAYANYTLRVGTTPERVEITLVGVIFTSIRVNYTLRVKILLCVQKPILCVLNSHSCVFNSHSCVLKLHSACKNYTLRVVITLERVKEHL